MWSFLLNGLVMLSTEHERFGVRLVGREMPGLFNGVTLPASSCSDAADGCGERFHWEASAPFSHWPVWGTASYSSAHTAAPSSHWPVWGTASYSSAQTGDMSASQLSSLSKKASTSELSAPPSGTRGGVEAGKVASVLAVACGAGADFGWVVWGTGVVLVLTATLACWLIH